MSSGVLRELTPQELNQLHQCLSSILKDFIYICDKYHTVYFRWWFCSWGSSP